jgi:hypothetical protein
MSTLKVTNIEPQSGSIVHLTGSLVLTDTLTARVLRTELTQSVTIFESGSTAFGDDLTDTHRITGSLSVTGSTASTTFSGIFIGALSSSAQIAADISGSWSPVSTSLATRLTTEEANVDTLQTDTSALQTDSGSFSTRITNNDTDINTLTTNKALKSAITGAFALDSASFNTRIAANESFSSSLDSIYATDAQVATAVSSLNTLTSSLATTAGNTFSSNQIISGTIDSNGAANKLRFFYNDFTDLPLASQYHGMFAHVHTTGSAYFAHGGNWVKLANSSSVAVDIASLTAVTSSYVTNANTASFASTGSNTFTGNQVVSSSVLLTLQQVTGSAPATPATGSLIVSGSPVQLYIYNGSGSGWNRV